MIVDLIDLIRTNDVAQLTNVTFFGHFQCPLERLEGTAETHETLRDPAINDRKCSYLRVKWQKQRELRKLEKYNPSLCVIY
jgi:hypothetical protein